MNQSRLITDILQELLDIIEYKNDKEKFIKKFEELNHLDTISNIFDSLPKSEQKKIKTLNEPEKQKTLEKYIKTEAYSNEFTKVSQEALLKLIDSMITSLTPQQKEKIIKLIELN